MQGTKQIMTHTGRRSPDSVGDRVRLGTDEWVCPNCLTFHLRDWNAAENIHDIGMIRFTEQTVAVSIA